MKSESSEPSNVALTLQQDRARRRIEGLKRGRKRQPVALLRQQSQ